MSWTGSREELTEHIKASGGQSWCFECLESFRYAFRGPRRAALRAECGPDGMFRHVDCKAAAEMARAED